MIASATRAGWVTTTIGFEVRSGRFGGCCEGSQAIGANNVDDVAQLLDALTEPSQFFGADAVVLRVTRLNIGILQLFEHCPIFTAITGPSIDETQIKSLSLRPKESKVVIVRRIERAC